MATANHFPVPVGELASSKLYNDSLTYRLSNLPERIQRKINLNSNGCWDWAAFRHQGYGRLRYPGFHTHRAHRIVYSILRGPIPSGLGLDHLCRRPCCVNPAHLEPVTQAVNAARGVGQGAINSVKTHCPKGHEYTAGNTYNLMRYTGKTFRVCKLCQAATIARYKARKAMRSVVPAEILGSPLHQQSSLLFQESLGGAQ